MSKRYDLHHKAVRVEIMRLELTVLDLLLMAVVKVFKDLSNKQFLDYK